MGRVYSVSEVVEQAVRTEQLGYDFYTSMAQKFHDREKLRELFQTLADKEKVHEERFKELQEIVGEEIPEGWEDVSEYMRAFVESEFFLGSEKALVRMKEAVSAEDAVEFAIRFEKETLLYFLGLRDAVRQKEIVEEIINEERSHVMWLSRFRASFL